MDFLTIYKNARPSGVERLECPERGRVFSAAGKNLFFLLYSIFLIFLAAGESIATPPVPKIPDWFEASAAFDSPLEIGAISNVSCSLKPLLFAITGRIEFELTDAAAPLAPLTPIHFSLKKGETASYKVPLHFVKEAHSKPITVNFYFDFPRKEMLAHIETMKSDPEEKEALVQRIKAAADIYQISRKLDFIITANESFTDFTGGVYDKYLENGFLIKSREINAGGVEATLAEIKRYEEFIATVRGAPELKTYLSTQMDLVSGEDRYLNYIYDAAYHYYSSGDPARAAEFFGRLLDGAVNAALNVDTAEVFIDASMNRAVMLYDAAKKKEALDSFNKIRDLCEKRSDARLRYAYYNLANYFRLEANPAAAAANYRKALAVKPGFTACTSELKKIEGVPREASDGETGPENGKHE